MAGNLIPLLLFQGFNTNGSFLAGGLLYSYAAGSSTPQATYTDTTLLTPNTNPVVLNALGQAEIALNPTQSYKFNLTDSSGNQMPGYPVDNVAGALNVSSIGSSLIPSITNTYNVGSLTYQWANVYAQTLYEAGTPVVSYPISTNEQTALTATGAMVVNWSRPPGDVDRYVTNTGYLSNPASMTDTTTAWNTAVAWAMIAGGEVTYGYTSQYRVTGIINCWLAANANQPGITIRSLGQSSHDNNCGILANHSLTAVFDCTGNDSVTFRDVAIKTVAGSAPSVGILTARNTSNEDLIIRLYNVKIQGTFTVACYYNYASEDDVLVGCYFANSSNTANCQCVVYTLNNIFSLSSAAGISTSTTSCIDHTMVGCQLANTGANATGSYCMYIDQASSIKCFSTWMYCGNLTGTRNGSGLVFVNGVNGASNFCTFDGFTGESSAYKQNYGFLFSANSANHVGWSVRNCVIPNNTNSIAALTGVTMTNFLIENINEGGSNHGISINSNLTSSFLSMGAYLLVIGGTSTDNVLMGYTENWTIGARSNDYWIDQGIANKTFTPAAGTITHVGTITFSNVKCQISGNECRCTFEMAAQTSLTPTAGQTITGLPFTAVGSGTVLFTDTTTLSTVIPNGFVSGTTIVCPAFTGTTNTILVDAFYYIA